MSHPEASRVCPELASAPAKSTGTTATVPTSGGLTASRSERPYSAGKNPPPSGTARHTWEIAAPRPVQSRAWTPSNNTTFIRRFPIELTTEN